MFTPMFHVSLISTSSWYIDGGVHVRLNAVSACVLTTRGNIFQKTYSHSQRNEGSNFINLYFFLWQPS
jgi:hypothetical protein